MINKFYEKLLVIFLLAFSNHAFAQDTLINKLSNKKLVISAYLDIPFIYYEPGIQVKYFFKRDQFIELKYGFSFYDFNIYSNANDFTLLPIAGDGPSGDMFQFPAGYGSIIKFGYGNEKSWVHEYRVTYKNLFFPTYQYFDGDPASDYTPIYNQSEKRQVIVLNYLLGKRVYEKGIFGIDFNLIFGGAYVIRYIKQYSVDFSGSSPAEINSPRIVKTFPRPSLGFEFILRLKAYEKKFKP